LLTIAVGRPEGCVVRSHVATVQFSRTVEGQCAGPLMVWPRHAWIHRAGAGLSKLNSMLTVVKTGQTRFGRHARPGTEGTHP
jgi:hypothetical protein